MKIQKPQFWKKKNNIISLLLLPFSLFIQLLMIIKKRLTIQYSFKIPIICVGNIYLGGTGKTPLSIMITHELKKLKRNPAIIKKYYSEHFDEHNLINNRLNCLILDKQRSRAIKNAEKKRFDVVILDDGFQDYSIKKDLNILCFNSNQLVGNGMTIPSGPLRESLSAIKKAQIIIINGNKNKLFENRILDISNKIKIFYSKYIPTNVKEFKNKKLFAFAGIGNPNNFFKLLTENKLNLKKKVSFPDHYQFSKIDIQKIIAESKKKKLDIITTEKDYFRIKDYGFKNIKFLKIKLEILEKDKLINQILNYI